MRKALFLNEKSNKYYVADEVNGSRILRPAYLDEKLSHVQLKARNGSKYVVCDVEMRSSAKTGVVYYQEIAKDVQKSE